MAAQLLSGAIGLAVGILIYSFFCLSCGVLTGFLVWVHRDRTSYVFFLTVFTTLGTLASIAQQVHTIIWWRDIKTEQYYYSLANVGKPEIAVAGPSFGLDLGLFYIQFACYNVESLLIFFWCAALVQSIFQLRSFRHPPRYTGLVAKALAILIPALLISALQAGSVQNNVILFFLLANSCMAIGLGGSALLLLVILGRYIQTRRQFLSWHVRYGKSSVRSGNPPLEESNRSAVKPPRQNIYDRWLLLRFTIGFLALGAFQIVIILFEVMSASQNDRESLGGSPDLSLKRARTDFIFFIPGVSPPLLTFIVFGTTKPFRNYMRDNFFPCFTKRPAPESNRNTMLDDNAIQRQEAQEMHDLPPNQTWTEETATEAGQEAGFRVRDNASDEVSILDKGDITGIQIYEYRVQRA